MAIYLKQILDGLPETSKAMLARELSIERLCEKCLSRNLIQILNENLNNATGADENCPKKEGFFGYRHKNSDIKIVNGHEELLVECKVLTGNNQCDIRNGFTELLENLVCYGSNQGAVLVLDERPDPKSLFTEALAKKEKKFVELFSKFEGVEIQLVHVCAPGGVLKVDDYPRHST